MERRPYPVRTPLWPRHFYVYNLILVGLSCISTIVHSQPNKPKIDSLERLLQAAKTAEDKLPVYHFLYQELKYSEKDKAAKMVAEYLTAARNAKNSFETARAYTDLAGFSVDSTEFFAKKALGIIAQNRSDKRFQALEMEANKHLGDEYRFIGQNDKALEHLNFALQKSATEDDSMLISTSIAQVLTQQSKWSESLVYFKKVRAYALKVGNTFLQAKSLKYIGDIYAELGNPTYAVECLQKSMDTYGSIQDTIGLLGGLASIAWIYAKNDSTTVRAIEHFERLVAGANAIGHEGFVTWAMVGITHCQLKYGDKDKALDYALRTYERAKDIPDEESLKWQILTNLAKAYNLRSDHAKGLRYAKQALAGFEKANENGSDELLLILWELAHAQMRTGDTEAAWKTLERYNQLSGELNLAKVKEEIARAEAQFRVGESELALAETKRAHQLEVEKAAAQRLFYLSLLGGSLLTLALGFFAYRRMQRDKSLIATQKAQLEQSLAEKETLLKEIHHRVKNNLQIISGLLEKQARNTSDEAAKKLMKEGQDRVFSMALVHQNLYQSENLSAIEIKSYLEVLTKNIAATQAPADKQIQVQLNVDDARLDIDMAIPVALILNELITNCFKYAFTGRASGLIQVDFQQKANEFLLKVRDNGIGLDPDFDLSKSKSLGLNLVQGLVRQLDGRFNFSSTDAGAVFEVQFAGD